MLEKCATWKSMKIVCVSSFGHRLIEFSFCTLRQSRSYLSLTLSMMFAGKLCSALSHFGFHSDKKNRKQEIFFLGCVMMEQEWLTKITNDRDHYFIFLRFFFFFVNAWQSVKQSYFHVVQVMLDVKVRGRNHTSNNAEFNLQSRFLLYLRQRDDLTKNIVWHCHSA